MQHISRRAAIAVLASCGLFVKRASAIGTTSIRVYKDPDCGCCTGWVRHLGENGFAAEVHGHEILPTLREKAGVPLHLVGCHAAEVGGYIIEGHVPAAAIYRLLQERARKRSAFPCLACRQALREWMVRQCAMPRSCLATARSRRSCSSRVCGALNEIRIFSLFFFSFFFFPPPCLRFPLSPLSATPPPTPSPYRRASSNDQPLRSRRSSSAAEIVIAVFQPEDVDIVRQLVG